MWCIDTLQTFVYISVPLPKCAHLHIQCNYYTNSHKNNEYMNIKATDDVIVWMQHTTRCSLLYTHYTYFVLYKQWHGTNSNKDSLAIMQLADRHHLKAAILLPCKLCVLIAAVHNQNSKQASVHSNAADSTEGEDHTALALSLTLLHHLRSCHPVNTQHKLLGMHQHSKTYCVYCKFAILGV